MSFVVLSRVEGETVKSAFRAAMFSSIYLKNNRITCCKSYGNNESLYKIAVSYVQLCVTRAQKHRIAARNKTKHFFTHRLTA